MFSSINGGADQFLADLGRVQQDLTLTERQITSGLKVQLPSDGPSSVSDILQLKSQIAQNTQVQTNLGTVKTQVDTAESALESAVSAVENAITLGTQGGSSTITAAVRQTLAQQVAGVLAQLLGVSRTQAAGVYVFSGDNSQSPQYQLDPSAPNGVDRLFVTSATAQVQDSAGIALSISKTAQDIFDHRNPDGSLASDNVFAAVQQLQVALQNNDQAGIDASMTALQQAHDYIGNQLAFYGAAQNRIASALDLAQKFQLQQKTDLSNRQDTDVAAAALALTQEQTTEQAALQARAKMPHTSLFDFLA